MTDAAAKQRRFWELAEPLLQQAGVSRSTMMGFPCLRFNGDFFACCDVRTGSLVVKLTETRVSALLKAGRVQPFAPNGRRFRAWALVSTSDEGVCVAFLDEALQHAAHRRRLTAPTPEADVSS